jgi:hypothetical protein
MSGVSYSQSQENYEYPVINWGIKGGLNAISPNYYYPYNRGEEMENGAYDNRVGFFASGFIRINLGSFFMQPELVWNTYNQGLSFDLPDEDMIRDTNLKLNYNTINLNMLIGYNIIKNGPFLINTYLGTSYKYNYRTDLSIDNKSNYSDTNPHYNYLGIIGLSLNISFAHFDIRYAMNLPDTDLNFNDFSNIPDPFKNVFIHKNENILSFSFGVMF